MLKLGVFFFCVGLSAAVFADTSALENQNSSRASAEKQAEKSDINYEFLVKQAAAKSAEEEKQKREAERQTHLAKTNQKIFKFRKDGALSFSDSRPFNTHYEVIVYNSCFACSLDSSVDWYNTKLFVVEFNDVIAKAANQYNVDPALVRAIIHAESAFNPLARSSVGAMGLMQLMPDTAKEMGVVDRSNPTQNIYGGVKYLAHLLQAFKGNQTLATAAYNAGPTAVYTNGGVPPFEETKTYVKRVRILYERYKNQKLLATN